MKGLSRIALLAVVASAGMATTARAGAFGMFYWCHNDCSCFCTRPVNAFTPAQGCGGCCYAGCNHNCWSCNPFWNLGMQAHAACNTPAHPTTVADCIHKIKHAQPSANCNNCGKAVSSVAPLKPVAKDAPCHNGCNNCGGHLRIFESFRRRLAMSHGHCGCGDTGPVVSTPPPPMKAHEVGPGKIEVVPGPSIQGAPSGPDIIAPPAGIPVPEKAIPIPHAPIPEKTTGMAPQGAAQNASVPQYTPQPVLQPVVYQMAPVYPGYNMPVMAPAANPAGWNHPGYYPVYPMYNMGYGYPGMYMGY